MNTASFVYRCYLENEDYEPAIKYFQLYRSKKDSFSSSNNRNEVIKFDYQYDFEKKEAIRNAKHAAKLKKENEIEEIEKNKQFLLITLSSIGLFLLFTLSIIILNRFVKAKRRTKIIEEQKQSVHDAHNNLKIKNEEIIDSINYAKRIQTAILPPAKLIKEYFTNSLKGGQTLF